MLKTLTLKNFRCFENHVIDFADKTLLVGKNNAGKSTCVEALRLVSIVTMKLGKANLINPHHSFDLPAGLCGVAPKVDFIDVHKECVFNRYGSAPALISALFKNGARLDVFVVEGYRVFGVVYCKDGKMAKTRSAVESASIPIVAILPQIGPLVDGEVVLSDDYVRDNFNTHRTSLHFRNQLRMLKKEHFDEFKSAVARTWPGLSVHGMEIPTVTQKGPSIKLFIRDGDFNSEVAWMGHGLQMWLQTIWFLVVNKSASVIILDEPDVYMHADIQRRLVRMLIADSRSFVIATHSPEMLSEVDPSNVVVLDRKFPRSSPASTLKVVQGLLDHIGSVHNISLARFQIYRKVLFVEGDDVSILKKFQNRMATDHFVSIDAIPSTDVKGWSGWPSVVTFARFLRDNGLSDIKIFCCLDRDYFPVQEIEKRLSEAKGLGIELHIWSAKELENFSIKAVVVKRLIEARIGTEVSIDEIQAQIDATLKDMEFDLFNNISEFIRSCKKIDPKKANQEAKSFLDKNREATDGIMNLVSGKELISKLSDWSMKKYGTSISLASMIANTRHSEIPDEISNFINRIADCRNLIN